MQQLVAWHRTSWGLLTFAVIELAVTYLFVSLAIDSGSLLHYTIAIVLFVGGVRNLVQLLWNITHHDHKPAKA